jgi:hypothetical protein
MIGVRALLGHCIPLSLVALLTAFTNVDDIAAVFSIALLKSRATGETYALAFPYRTYVDDSRDDHAFQRSRNRQRSLSSFRLARGNLFNPQWL